MARSRKDINKAHLEGMEQMMKKNDSRFIIGLALKDDGTVDALMNMHDSTIEEMTAVWRTFLKQYVAALEKHRKK